MVSPRRKSACRVVACVVRSWRRARRRSQKRTILRKMMLRRISCAASLALTAVSTGCLTDTGSEPLMIVRVASTDQQQAPGGSRLPLRVTVATADGTATVRGEVLWSILSQPGEAGDGSLSDSLTLSDGTGLAEVELTLGRAEGVTIVRAVLRADRTQSVDLTSTATRTPVLTSVSPTAFGGEIRSS